MQTRIAVMSIIVENTESANGINRILHEYANYIIFRTGVPYAKRCINLISIGIEAPQDIISSVSGKIGKLDGISVKTAYSGTIYDD